LIAALDNTFLTVLLNPNAVPRPNPATGIPIEHCRQRIEALVDDLSRKGATLLIPAPALAEAVCATESIEAYFEALQQFSAIELAPFDGKAAYEFGKMIRDAKAKGDKKSGQIGDWQHIKMDRTIVAIAVSRSANVLYSDDTRQKNFATSVGLEVKSTWDLELPPEYAQRHLSETGESPWPPMKKPPNSNDLEQPPAP
jgi:hypothetical protein